jgi:hypothetical protein
MPQPERAVRPITAVPAGQSMTWISLDDVPVPGTGTVAIEVPTEPSAARVAHRSPTSLNKTSSGRWIDRPTHTEPLGHGVSSLRVVAKYAEQLAVSPPSTALELAADDLGRPSDEGDRTAPDRQPVDQPLAAVVRDRVVREIEGRRDRPLPGGADQRGPGPAARR